MKLNEKDITETKPFKATFTVYLTVNGIIYRPFEGVKSLSKALQLAQGLNRSPGVIRKHTGASESDKALIEVLAVYKGGETGGGGITGVIESWSRRSLRDRK